MKKKLLILIVIGVFLLSCASSGEYWTKSGGPPECHKAVTELVDALAQIANEHGLQISDKQKTALFDRFVETDCKVKTGSGFTRSVFEQDRKECIINVLITDGGNYISRYKLDKNVKLCLEAKGYYKVRQ